MSRLTTKLPLMLYTTKPQLGYNVKTSSNLHHHPDRRPHSAHDSRLVFVCVKRRKHSAHCGSVDPTIQIPSWHMKSKLRYFVVNKGSLCHSRHALYSAGVTCPAACWLLSTMIPTPAAGVPSWILGPFWRAASAYVRARSKPFWRFIRPPSCLASISATSSSSSSSSSWRGSSSLVTPGMGRVAC